MIVAHFSPGPTAAPPQEPTWDKPEAEAHRQVNEDADNDWRGRTGQRINRSEEERCTDALDGHRYRSNHDIDESIDSILDDFVTETARRWYRADGRR